MLYTCSEKSGCNNFSVPTGLPIQNGDPAPNYTSCQFPKDTSSFGYGWNSAASERIIEDGSGNLTYKTSSGGFIRWLLDNGNYVPAFPGNYTEASKNPGSTDARYTLTFKDQTVLEFNSDGRIKRSIDRNNNQMVYTYNGTTGFLEKIDDLRGRTLHYDYGTRTDGQPVSIRANNLTTGRQTQFEYISSSDPNVPNRLQKIIDPEGNETVFSYYPSGLMETITDPRGIVSNRFFYDSFNRLEREVSYDETEIEYVYGFDPSSELDFVEVYQRDLAVTNPEPDRYTYTLYDPFGNPILVADLVDDSGPTPVFNVTQMFYNDPNSPFLMTARLDPNLTIVDYEYDANGNVTKTIDKDGNETLFAYADTVDSSPINPKHRNLVRLITRPDVTVDGVVTTYDDTELQYDANGNVSNIIDARSKVTTMTYTSDGLVETIQDRRGNTSEFVYEGTAFDGVSSRNLLQVKVPKGLVPADGFRTATMTYDAYDNVATVTNALGHQVTSLFDDLDRPDTVTDARGKVTSFFYQDDLLDEVHLPANNGSSSSVRKTSMSYDNSSRLIQVDRDVATTGPQELRVKYQYSSFSQLKELTRIKNGVERSFEMNFDQLGRQTSMTDPTAEQSTVSYAPFCVEQAQTSARGIRRRMSFNNRCLLTQVAVGDPDATDPLELSVTRELRTFLYDELGRLVLSAQDRGNGDPSDPDFGIPYTEGVQGIDKYVEVGTNVRFYIHDELDRLTELTYEDGRTAYWEYDDEGNVTKFTDPDGKVTRYEYYRDHLLYRVIVERPSQADRVFTYSYDAAGRLEEIEYPAGTGIKAHFVDDPDSPTPGSGFDENGNLRYLWYRKNGGLIRRFEWTYDDSNNRQSQLDVTPSKAVKQEFGYDFLDRLETVKRAEATTVAGLGALQLVSVYGFDESDNRIRFEIPNVNPALTQVFDYTFDDADNILTRTKSTNSVTDFIESYTHDEDGNVTSWSRSDTGETVSVQWDDFDRLVRISSSSQGRLQDNRYDVNGIRNRKLDKNGNSSLEYDVGISMSASRPGSGASAAPSISYVSGHLLMGAEVDGTFQWFIHNALSSVTDVLNDSGNVIKSYEFDEYGNPISVSAGEAAPKSFVGGLSVHDDTSDSGLWMMGHRHYQPTLGRFLSRDPIGHAGGMNLYSYANSNPSTFADPTGLFTGAEAAAAARVFIAQMETMIASGSGAAAAGPNPLILGTLMTGVIGQYLIDNYVEDYYSRAPDVLASGRTFAYVNQGGDAVGHLDTAMRFKKLADAKGATFSEPCPGGSINTNASRFGHTFTRHGQNSLRFIMMRFADPKFSENEQGQFLDDQAAAAFILANWPHNKRKAYSVPISAGVPARIVLRDGSFDVATHVLIKPRPRGNGISSAFPIR